MCICIYVLERFCLLELQVRLGKLQILLRVSE